MAIQQAIDATTQRFAHLPRRYVLDAPFDDRTWFGALGEQEFVIRGRHYERVVEVYNDQLDRWEREARGDLVEVVPFTHTGVVHFTHARKTRAARLQFGWFLMRVPDTRQQLWVLVAHEERIDRTCVLLPNVPRHASDTMRAVYDDWRLRAH